MYNWDPCAGMPPPTGRLWHGIWAGVSRLFLRLVWTTPSAVSFVIVTFLRLALVSVVSRLRWFRFYFFSFAFGVEYCRGCGGVASFFSNFALGVGAFCVPPLSRLCFVIVSRLVLGVFMCRPFVFPSLGFRYSIASYSDHSLKINYVLELCEKSQKSEFGVVFLPRLKSAPRLLGGESGL